MVKTVFGKLMSTYVAIILVTLSTLGFCLSHLLENYFFTAKEQELLDKGQELVKVVGHLVVRTSFDPAIFSVLRAMDSFIDARVWIVNRQGLIIAASQEGFDWEGFQLSSGDLQEVLLGRTITNRGQSKYFSEPMLTVGLPILGTGSDTVLGAVFLHSPVVGVSQTVSQVRHFILLGALLSITLAFGLGLYLSRTFSSPLRQMHGAALAMAEGDFSRRVSVEQEDEIGELGRSFNYLASRLQNTIDALHQEKAKFESMIFSISEGVIAVDPQGRILLVNAPARRWIKEDVDLPIGTKLCESVSLAEMPELYHRVMTEDAVVTQTVNLTPQKALMIIASPIHDTSGAIGGVVILLHDISQLHQTEQLRRDFFANVSHELRTPLTAIAGYLQPVIDGTVTDSESVGRYLRIIQDETLRLSKLIDELLDFSRLEAGQLNLELEPFDIVAVVDDVCNQLGVLADSKMVRLHRSLPGAKRVVVGDEKRIRQVLLNLVDNAIKFTPADGDIYVRVCDRAEGIMIEVEDTGCGILPDELPLIFERFFKADRSRTRRDGTGLGLAIVKSILDAHGLIISVQSKPDVGTKFSFSFPLRMIS
ncbi:MAG: ATP-binding protein [Limnochordia bacterium]|nr:ATP-binding protein [Limnochordia bacterium]